MKSNFFWFLIPILFIFQIIFTINSNNYIRYEELAESVRNVWWFQQRIIYDGQSSSVGWYAILLPIYNIFGFSLLTVKYFKLVFFLVSLICLSLVFKKYLNWKNLLVPLITIALSPTLLYYTTVGNNYGIDLLYFPITIYLVLTINFKNKITAIAKTILLWSLTMLACMSYPTFFYCLIPLGLIYFYPKPPLLSKYILISLISFFLPLLLAFWYIKNNSLLIYDPITKSGIFRGAGSFVLNWQVSQYNLQQIASDWLGQGKSYYFELANGDLSQIYPMLTLIVILAIGIRLTLTSRNKKLRLILYSLWAMVGIGFIMSIFTYLPGMRRTTALVVSFYVLYALSWQYSLTQHFKKAGLKWVLIGLLLLLPIHHLLVYPANLSQLNKGQDFSYYEKIWFKIEETPQKSLDKILDAIKSHDVVISCNNLDTADTHCRYAEVYAGLAGSCYWNKLSCHQIQAIDPNTQKAIPLSYQLWQEYYFNH